MAPVAYFYLKPIGQRIYYRRADAVKSSRNLISAAAKLTARMKNGKYDANRRNSFLRVNTYRYSSAVIGNTDYTVVKNFNQYFVAISRQCLVNSVIHKFIDKMVETALTCRADIHSGAFSYSLQSLQYLYGIFVVAFRNRRRYVITHFYNIPFISKENSLQ